MCSSAVITGFCRSDPGAMARSTFTPPLPKKPKTRIKISGKARVKTTAEGLRIIDRKLAFARASVAFGMIIRFIHCVSYYPSRHSLPVRLINTSSRLAFLTSFLRSKPLFTRLSIRLSGVSRAMISPCSTKATRSQSCSASSI